MTNTKRVNSAYKEGQSSVKNPPGFSELFQGRFVSKGGDECLIHSLTEQVRNDIGCILYSNRKEDFLADTDTKIIKWLGDNIFSYASFAFLCGNTDRHVFSQKELEILETRLAFLKEKVTRKSTNFVTYNEKFCLLLDKLRIDIRSLESAYWRWSTDDFVIGHLREQMKEDPQGSLIRHQNMVIMGDILNRFSSVLNWMNRFTYEQNFSAEIDLIEWSGSIKTMEII